MPSDHRGILLRSEEDAVLYLKNPVGVSRSDRRAQLDALAALNQNHYQSYADPEVLSRIQQHEMAYRMQASVPELMDLSHEPASTFELYGEESRQAGTFAACCLNARRLAEKVFGIFKFSIEDGMLMADCLGSMKTNVKMWIRAVRRSDYRS